MTVWLSGDQQIASKQLQGRLRLLVWGFLFIFGILALRALQLTIFPEEEYRPREAVPASELTMRRADITDRNGTLLATSLKVASLYADPQLMDDKKAVLAALEKIFPDLDMTRIRARIAKGGRFVWIKRHITPTEAAAVNALGDPGLEFMTEYKRVYPMGKLAAQLVGAVNVDGTGLEGAEKFLNERLSDADKPVRLAIDSRYQSILQEEVSAQIDHFEAIGGAGLVIDIPSGEVLAAVSLPTFNPNRPGTTGDRGRFNRLSSGVYEMGSSFKIFSTAAYLETKNPPLSKTFDAQQPLHRGRFTISDYHPEKRVMTIPDIFMHSSNIGTALMAEDIGSDALKGFYEKLGFLDKLETDLMTTSMPLVPKPWRPISTLTASYGHGIAVTPLHLAEGVLRVLNTKRHPGLEFVLDGDIRASKKEAPVVSETTADTVRRLLRLTVRAGTGGKADVKGFLVGGKTATAEKISGKGYSKSALLSSFIGIYPSDKPTTLVIVMIDEPKGQKDSYGYATAGWTAAPAVGRTISRITAMRGETPRDPKRSYDPSDQLMTYLPEFLRAKIDMAQEGSIGNDR